MKRLTKTNCRLPLLLKYSCRDKLVDDSEDNMLYHSDIDINVTYTGLFDAFPSVLALGGARTHTITKAAGDPGGDTD